MIYFAASIFLSAFLLFQVEPMIAKYILPWFGGSTAVWSTVMLFFQILLTGGYAYAAWLTSKAHRREKVHLFLLGFSLLLMLTFSFLWKSPITPSSAWKPPEGAFPVWQIFKILFISVGLPYFLLSSNSPLIQAALFAFQYRLVAGSNYLSDPGGAKPDTGMARENLVTRLRRLCRVGSVWGNQSTPTQAFPQCGSGSGQPGNRLPAQEHRLHSMDRVGRHCLCPVTGRDQPNYPGGGIHPIPVGPASDRLPIILRPGFFERTLVLPATIYHPLFRSLPSGNLGPRPFGCTGHLAANRHLYPNVIRRLHGLPW